MARVYKARLLPNFRQKDIPEYYALKYVPLRTIKNNISESQFLKLSECDHIVKSYNSFLSNDGYDWIMQLELCEGTLEPEIRKFQQDMDYTKIIRFFKECLVGLKYIHER